jgi:hypothetical protein
MFVVASLVIIVKAYTHWVLGANFLNKHLNSPAVRWGLHSGNAHSGPDVTEPVRPSRTRASEDDTELMEETRAI